MKKEIGFDGGFTVLMSVYQYDKPHLLEKAIESVLQNTLTPNEFIIVIDGFVNQKIRDVITRTASLNEGLIKIIRLRENLGLARALNIGIQDAEYDWIVRADADDINVPNRFELLASMHVKNPALSLIGGWILEVNEGGESLGIRNVPCGAEKIIRFAKRRNPFNHMTVAYRKNDVINLGGYPSIYLREDYALWCKMIQCGLLCDNTSNILVHATAGSGMYARRGGLKYAIAEFHMQKYLVNIGMKSIFWGCLDGIYRGLIFILPTRLRGYIYENILRSSTGFEGVRR